MYVMHHTKYISTIEIRFAMVTSPHPAPPPCMQTQMYGHKAVRSSHCPTGLCMG